MLIPVLIKNADLTQLAGNEQLKRDIEDELDLDKKSLSLYTRISQIARNFFEVTGFFILLEKISEKYQKNG